MTQVHDRPLRDARSGAPVTGGPDPSREEVAAVVAAARDAARTWGRISFADRKSRLLAYKHALVRRQDELADLISSEAGKPAADARVEVLIGITHLDWAATHAQRVLRRRTVGAGLLGANQHATVGYEPYGVVGVIGPWNYPLFTPGGSLWYALAAGNAVVFKPSEYTPGVGALLAEVWASVDPDPRIFQTVTGSGGVGVDLIGAGIDKVAFTGSTPTARKVMAQAAQTLTPVVVECGGKDAMIIAADADLAAAAKAAAFGAFGNSGQTCIGVKRVYVVDTVADEFLALLDDELAGVRAGAGPEANYGPMVMPQAPAGIADQLADAVAHGGAVRHGGRDAFRAPYVDPIVVVDVPEGSTAVTDESFGPLLVVNPVPDVATAVQYANAVRLGLGASVFTASRRVARQVAADLRAGSVMVNAALAFMAVPALPFGGRGDSGFGRIHGADGLREFSVVKSVSRQLVPLPFDVMTLRHDPGTVGLLRTLLRVRHGGRRR